MNTFNVLSCSPFFYKQLSAPATVSIDNLSIYQNGNTSMNVTFTTLQNVSYTVTVTNVVTTAVITVNDFISGNSISLSNGNKYSVKISAVYLSTPYESVTKTIFIVDSTASTINTSESRTVFTFTNSGSITLPPATSVYQLNILAVGGGGGGGVQFSGSGGGGGFLESQISVNPVLSNTVFTMTIGQGGASSRGTAGYVGITGENTVVADLTAYGGGGAGGGGNASQPSNSPIGRGRDGASGGGGSRFCPGGTGIVGQGFNGNWGNFGRGGAGGGAGGLGSNPDSTTSIGGPGKAPTLAGMPKTSYFGGGGALIGGIGGGGSFNNTTTAINRLGSGTPNTGGGASGDTFGGGGSGIVIITINNSSLQS